MAVLLANHILQYKKCAFLVFIAAMFFISCIALYYFETSRLNGGGAIFDDASEFQMDYKIDSYRFAWNDYFEFLIPLGPFPYTLEEEARIITSDFFKKRRIALAAADTILPVEAKDGAAFIIKDTSTDQRILSRFFNNDKNKRREHWCNHSSLVQRFLKLTDAECNRLDSYDNHHGIVDAILVTFAFLPEGTREKYEIILSMCEYWGGYDCRVITQDETGNMHWKGYPWLHKDVLIPTSERLYDEIAFVYQNTEDTRQNQRMRRHKNIGVGKKINHHRLFRSHCDIRDSLLEKCEKNEQRRRKVAAAENLRNDGANNYSYFVKPPIIVMCDGDDVFIQRPAETILHNYNRIIKQKVAASVNSSAANIIANDNIIISPTSVCISHNCRKKVKNTFVNNGAETKDYNGISSAIYSNSGFLVANAIDFVDFWNYVAERDSQLAIDEYVHYTRYQEMMKSALDSAAAETGLSSSTIQSVPLKTLPISPRIEYDLRDSMVATVINSNKYSFLKDYYEFEYVTNETLTNWITGEKRLNVSAWQLKNKYTGAVPAFLHFPGTRAHFNNRFGIDYNSDGILLIIKKIFFGIVFGINPQKQREAPFFYALEKLDARNKTAAIVV